MKEYKSRKRRDALPVSVLFFVIAVWHRFMPASTWGKIFELIISVALTIVCAIADYKEEGEITLKAFSCILVNILLFIFLVVRFNKPIIYIH